MLIKSFQQVQQQVQQGLKPFNVNKLFSFSSMLGLVKELTERSYYKQHFDKKLTWENNSIARPVGVQQ